MSTADNNTPQGNPFPLRVRIVQLIFLTLAVVATLLLARWQWNAWHQSDGSFQNLGYAIQWPVFGILLIVAYRKYIRYEKERVLGDDQAAVPDEVKNSMREIPTDLLANASPSHISTVDFEDDRRRNRRNRTPNNSLDE
ncbi:hypothetical protein F7230_09460 [Corynebacterium sp. 320]|uniref:DNA-binding transcriptional regulator of glucitol operon n=1 Tax=Corynebacterium zhongnanshanii TaxID=2768834 RepID=A0ABQ6VDQ1_9CORY|nr:MULTISPECIES: hypothetical protein [Corynebacterium]KAB1501435.1 hypothetical protein F7230_09460 [Corynebacterium sp. 320]KAB1551440.1 hypothetical protein F7233_08025 [Corynebacterium sp. 321]KAB1551732.1 hypothetical protein F7232_06250 [Corynebacterium sp. 319]KAB3520983.1 hypothetical protein F8377_07090 [Corynebacterium zhongnanshanii]KAB3525793.1 hypothetical protein F8354_09460 [Corynebacterium sp. 250]